MEVIKGRPIPKQSGPPRKYPFDKMAVGDSFDIPIDRFVSRAAVYSSAKWAGVRASVRKLSNLGIYRVWRTR